MHQQRHWFDEGRAHGIGHQTKLDSRSVTFSDFTEIATKFEFKFHLWNLKGQAEWFLVAHREVRRTNALETCLDFEITNVNFFEINVLCVLQFLGCLLNELGEQFTNAFDKFHQPISGEFEGQSFVADAEIRAERFENLAKVKRSIQWLVQTACNVKAETNQIGGKGFH